MNTHLSILSEVKAGNYRALARALTLVENNINPASSILRDLDCKANTTVLGITGPPGAGKSTLVNVITNHFVAEGKRIAILAIDPTSPFNFGSLLGDRIRMASQFNNPNVYIRSLATRGALGGISAKTIEMVDVLKSAKFDLIIVETVGVGQSEVEIAGLADKTIVVLVPESGDEIQNIKSGLMEIADCFVINKADRDGADTFTNNLKKIVHQGVKTIPILKTIADKNSGIDELCAWIAKSPKTDHNRKAFLFAEKAWKLIQHKRMIDIDKKKLREKIQAALKNDDFNIYRFADSFDRA
ncbi:methylmalonyl Co-A mutase-associated GTPase MeaB [Pedobacter sp. HDW13]|uniref:methylmalonyl Co-A mutase-associated GTPase MeaB n=1 Tax=unclassified Pedobacter TaxID=2628915 RepID=UPI000F5A101C|nr:MULTISPECIES: methylmalonyl Co-A mutase-associated GTPase MeaB [unclassified Pedobacter]QIL39731.1 methylmalonyl Co-A mutase-associated GTPase MeaB [Pedobacter sp. HDW13]RQO79786.1 methylmalonyl Co-A mutase-associated GTPase MeaB [Pedobacter sp. KBW01]